MAGSYLFALTIFLPFFISGMEKTKAELEKEAIQPLLPVLAEAQSSSALCELFGIAQDLLALPNPVQFIIGRSLKKQYLSAFTDWTQRRPIARLKLSVPKQATGTELKAAITDFLLINDGNILVACTSDGRIATFQVDTMQLIQELKINDAIHECPQMAINDSETLLAVSAPKKVIIVALPSLKKEKTLELGQEPGKLGFLKKVESEDERIIISCGQWCQIWNVDSGQGIRTFHLDQSVEHVAFIQNKTKYAVISRHDDTEKMFLTLYDCASGLPKIAHKIEICDSAYYESMIFLDENHLILAVNNTFVLFSLLSTNHDYKGPFIEADRVLRDMTTEICTKSSSKKSSYTTLSYDAHKKWLCCHGMDMQTIIYDLASGKKIRTLIDPKSGAHRIKKRPIPIWNNLCSSIRL